MIQSMINMVNMVTGNSTLGKIALSAGAVLTAYFTPIVGLLSTCFAFTVVDMVYGIKVAKKLGKSITSRKNWKGTLAKIKQEFIIIALAHMLEYSIGGHDAMFLLSGGTTVIIAMTELWSILENLNTLDPDGPWRALGKFMRKKGEDYLQLKLDLEKNGTADNEAGTKDAV